MSRLTFEQVKADLADLGEVVRVNKTQFTIFTIVMGEPKYLFKVGFCGRRPLAKYGYTLKELVAWAENRRRLLAEVNKQVEPPKTIRTKPLLSREAAEKRREGKDLPMWMLDVGDVIELIDRKDDIYYFTPITILILPRKWGDNWHFIGRDCHGEQNFCFPDHARWNIIGKTTEPLPHDPTLLVRR